MAYQRVPYRTLEDKQSAAYWDSETSDAWDVFTRMPVALLESPDGNHFVEWSPKSASSAIGSEPSEPLTRRSKRVVTPVTVQPIVTPWMLIPVTLFAIGMFWIQETFGIK